MNLTEASRPVSLESQDLLNDRSPCTTSTESSANEALTHDERLDLLRSSTVFASLPQHALSMLATGARVQSMKDGHLLVREGESSEQVYVLARGELVVTRFSSHEAYEWVGNIEVGDVVGGIELVTGGRRSTTVSARGPATVLGFHRSVFEGLLISHLDTRQELERVVHAQLTSRHFNIALIKTFGRIGPEYAARLDRQLERRSLEPGEILFEAGEFGADGYLVISGSLLVSKGTRAYGEVDSGELVGEMALMRAGPRTARVTALRSTQLARIDRETFVALTRDYPENVLGTTRVLLDRISERGVDRRRVPQVMSLIPACERAGADIREFAERLAGSFGEPLAVIDIAALERQGIIRGARQLAPDAKAWLGFSGWLEEQRQAGRTTLLLAETDAQGWLSRCAAEADRILVVGRGAEPASPRLLEWLRTTRHLQRAHDEYCYPSLWCVILHSAATGDPTNTRDWLEDFRPSSHHHVRDGSDRDMARLVRFLRGDARGLALSGGAIRGAAHLGVYAALREFGLDIDYVVGTSVGAVTAALIASDRPGDELQAKLMDMIEHHGALWRALTLPIFSLMRGRLEAAYRYGWGEAEFEDTWIPSAVVATNLTTAREHVFDTGPIWQGVLASSSMPGVVEPVVLDGEIYCDGGIVDNLPIDVLLARDCGYTIGSTVGMAQCQRMHTDRLPSPWMSLVDRILSRRRSGPAFPGLAEIVLRAVGVTSDRRQAQTTATTNLLIAPPLDGFGIMSFKQLRAIVDAGYHYTRGFLEEHADELPGA